MRREPVYAQRRPGAPPRSPRRASPPLSKSPCATCRCVGPRRSLHDRLTSWTASFVLLAATLGVLAVVDARGEVFHSRESALRLAFPGCDDVETRTLVLDERQATRVVERAGAKLASKIVRTYVGRRDGAVVGYAFIETHRVRSLPETVMVVVDATGEITGTHLLAFHEPREYLPPERWMAQFAGARLDDDLGLGRGIAGIAGSTLTAQAVTACVRRAAAIAEVCLVESTASVAVDAHETAGTR